MRAILVRVLVGGLLAISVSNTGVAQEPLRGPCRVSASTVDVTPTVEAKIETDAKAAITGEPISLKWDVRTDSLANDVYLVVELPNAIRFRGDGFVALPPNARAPRSIRTGEGSTRLITPLAAPIANPTGMAELVFFESGVQRVEWQIVQLPPDNVNPCIERTISKGEFSVEVRLGRPQLVTQNHFAVGTPKQTYISNDLRYLLLEFTDRYQVLDQATGDLLFDHGGTSPRFSHVGRFVTSYDGSGRLEILDILAQRIIFTSSAVEQGDFGGVRVALWMDNDAAVIFGYGRKGAVGLTFPLIEARNIFSGSIHCNACHAFGSTSLLVDMDNLVFLARGQDNYKTSLLEAADDISTIEFWESQKPEERGPEPIRPKFPIPNLNRVGQTEDSFMLTSDGKSQDDFLWAFSDTVTVAFYDVWNGDVVKEKALLSSKIEQMRTRSVDRNGIDALRGKVAKRTVEVGGTVVSPKSYFDSLTASLEKFDVRMSSSTRSLKSVRTKLPGENFEKQTDADLRILQELMKNASRGRQSLVLRKDATKEAHGTTLFARDYGRFSACAIDEGPEDSRPWEGTGLEEPPIVSANRLIALWKAELAAGTLYVIQQIDHCGTAPDLYGDLISVYAPVDAKLPLQFARIAASYSEGGAVSDPAGVDQGRSALGASLRLSVTPTLSLTLVDKRFLIITSKDSGSSAIFEAPSMKFVQLIEGMESPLDIDSVTLTSDYATLVQINASGAISFFDVASKQLSLRGRFIDDEIVLFDNALRYESSAEGAAYVYVRVPGSSNLYTLDQFSNKLASPGIGRKALKAGNSSVAPPAGIAPPALRVERQSASYVVTAWSEVGLSTLYVAVDGQLIQNIPIAGSSIEKTLSADQLQDGRWINFFVEDQNHVRSVVRAFSLGDKRYPGTLRVYSFGADNFQGARFGGRPVNNLFFASSDAERFEAGIRRLVAPSYSQYESVKIAGTRTTKDEILRAIKRLSEATKSGDSLIVFFASHGFVGADGFSVLIPGSRDGSEVVPVPFTSIVDALKASRGRVFLFLDACHSANATQDVAAEQVATSQGDVTIITASKGAQSSLESASWGGGIFTTAVLQALAKSGSKLSSPLSIEGLYAGVRAYVSSQTHGSQTPWLRRSEWHGMQSIN
jgi:hypothetical protein